MSASDPTPLMDNDRVEMLRALDNGAGAMLGEIVDLWIAEVPPRIDALRLAVSAGDAETACMTAHGIKGSSYNMGASLAGDIANELEQRGRAGDLEDAAPMVDSLEEAFARSRAALLAGLGRDG